MKPVYRYKASISHINIFIDSTLRVAKARALERCPRRVELLMSFIQIYHGQPCRSEGRCPGTYLKMRKAICPR